MPKKTKVKYVKPLSREEELAILQAQTEEIRKNPEIGLRILRSAGIVDENGKLTKYYRQTAEEETKMPKQKPVKNVVRLSREEELRFLEAQNHHPELAVKIAQKAGILDKNGYYKQTAEETEMPKKKQIKNVVRLSREEELAILDAEIEEAKKNPARAKKTAQNAGILDENGKLTAYYRQTS